MPSAWNPKKVSAFKQAFYDFTENVFIDSKETGGSYRLSDGIYRAQKVFLDGVFSGLEEDIHDFKVLKSRQLGITTISRALSVFWIGMHDGLRAAMVFDKAENTEEARKEITQMINGLPKALKFPAIVGGKGNRYGLSLENNSRITFMSAGVRSSRSTGALGASKGLNFLHGSEMCSWDNDEGVVSLQQALAETFENRLYIWESTARGYNQWHDIWTEACADTTNQRAIFIGWWAKDNQVIRKEDPAYNKYGRLPPTESEKQRIADVKRLYGWDITQEQLAWFRRKSDPLAAGDELAPEDPNLQQNQPWTAHEAFIQSGSTFFAPEKLKERMDVATRYKFQPHKYYPGSNFLETEVLPARNSRDFQLKVWDEPDKDGEYVIAVDPAFGHDEKNDRSAIQVIQCFADGVEQVAEFASASVNTHQLAWITASLVGWYSNVTLIIELNGPGDAVWREYMGLRNILMNGYLKKEATEKGLRNIFNNMRNFIYSRSDSMGAGSSYHWKTTSTLKVSIMERLRDLVHNGGIVIKSQETLEEMKAISRDGDKIEAGGRKKDDRAIALALAVRCWEDRVRRKLITTNRTKEAFHIMKQMSPENRYSLYTRNQLSNFFKQKAAIKRQENLTAVRHSWRGR